MLYSLHIDYRDGTNPFVVLNTELHNVLRPAKFVAEHYPNAEAFISAEDSKFNGSITDAVKWLETAAKTEAL
jgi:hypothetical protein